MKKNIPHIKFDSGKEDDLGFEIVPLKTIFNNKDHFEHDPESPHQLNFYNLIFFTEGEGQHFIDFKWFPVKKNSLVYLSKEQITAFKFLKKLKGDCLIFTEAFFIRCFAHLPKDFIERMFNPHLFSPVLEITNTSDFQEYFKLLKKEFFDNDTFNKNAIIESLFTILFSKAEKIKQNQEILKNDSYKLIIFQNFSTLLEENFSKNRNAKFYAKELTITYKHLNSICNELINKTAKSVITDYIILKAKRNLINSNIKSTELAYKLGFEEPTNFTKFFKKNTGLTPKSFKNSYK